jgi:hypothetical protein
MAARCGWVRRGGTLTRERRLSLGRADKPLFRYRACGAEQGEDSSSPCSRVPISLM